MGATVTARPIIFSGPMVRAILAGKKTQTRRALRIQPIDIINSTCVLDGMRCWTGLTQRDPNRGAMLRCSYGEIGDRLWVRETWQQTRAKRSGERFVLRKPQKDCGDVHYSASPNTWCGTEEPPAWRPSIHMPRWASRLTLEITDVRVQRVQEISGRDCAAEGCDPDWEQLDDATSGQDSWEEPEEFIEECEDECDWINCGNQLVHSREHKEWERDRLNYALRLSFENLWDSINAARGFSWRTNPWVWAITFKVVE